MQSRHTCNHLFSFPHHVTSKPLTLLLANTNSPTTTTCRLSVLATNTQTPEVPQTTMRTDLLHPLQILTQLRVDAVGEDLAVLSVDDVALPVEKPAGDLVLCRVLDDGDNAFEFFASKLTGAVFRCQLFRLFAFDLMVLCIPLVEVDVGLLAHQVGVALADTLNLGQGVHDLLLACSICEPFCPLYIISAAVRL
jgi:hypothetical protein